MIDTTLLIQLAQLGTIAIGFLGVAVTLRSHRRQMHVQMFIEFSSRFHEVLGAMPVHVWMSFEGGGSTLPRSEELTKSCLQCFHIVANLYHLHKAGYVSQELWKPWQRGFRRTMEGPVLRQEWLAVEAAFSHLPDFCGYMRGLMSEKTALCGRCPHCRQIAGHAGEE